MLWACILLPQLALDGVLRRRPPSNEPLVLVSGPAQARIVHAANASARAAGIYRGQRLTAAQALLQQFVMVEHDPEDEARWHRLLAAWAYRYSAEVGLYAHAVVLEVSRSLNLFGPWPRFESLLRDDLQELAFRHRIALAPTPHAAYVLAGVHDGLAVMSPEILRETLSPVPITRARLPADATQGLPSMGIRTLGQVLKLPRAGLQRRFGTELVAQLDRLTGDEPTPMDSYRPPDAFEQRMEWTHEIEHVEALVFPLRRLTSDLAAYLAGRDGGVQRFELELEHRSGLPTCVTVGMLAAARDATLLFDCARGRLERLELHQPVLAMRLVASDLPPFVPAGRDLFDTRPTHAVPLDQLRERLRARLGEQAIQHLHRTVDPRPERAQSDAAHVKAATSPETLPRPTWLLAAPCPLRGPAPEVLAGPERIETGWWDGGDIRRDYYVVRTAQGQCAWVYCAPGEQGNWMLHGWFA
ncbi:Y-family DNA polymerase [Dyella japonica]|uniref:DNA repair nucleotidyltransferase n=1 Tax=Dyella japonica DSM 16301 TaxID=1440762 RepID=A0A0G9H5W1_9GAMM|nr:DNA polymerase Y family protein [Dyella japonica]KLD64861.1 DNA repair nucleotidyltransferase [Dyella japonica DSM 16301]